MSTLRLPCSSRRSAALRGAPAPLAAALAAIATLGAPPPAAAQTAIATSAPPAPPAERRLEARAGMLLGGSDVGDADGFSLGVTTGLGYRIGDLTLRARLDHYRTGDSSDEAAGRRGRGTRVGGAVRYALASARASADRDRGGIGVDFWGEIGAGLEHVAWRRGGVLDRPSGEVALGFELDGYGRAQRGRRRHIGYFMGFRALFAQGPAMDGPAVCGGPCSRATRPSRLDTSMFYEIGVHWGR
jgi:hypothetical protein